MQIKFGPFTFAVIASANQLSFVFSINETTVSEACAAWLIFSNDDMPLYAGLSVGRWNDIKRNLRSLDIAFRNGKWYWKKG